MIIKISAVLAVAITVMLLMAMTVNPAFAGNQVVDEEKGAVDHVTGSSSLKAKEIEPIDVKMERVKSIVDFDDISLPPDTWQQIINYAGITWDSGLPDFWGGSDGGWVVYNNKIYAEAVSPPNYVVNGWGAKNPGFDFSSIVKFNGAYFMNVEHGDCPSAVRFVGYVSGVPIYYSGWLTLRSTPAYLSANFPGVDRVVVEMDGDGWFAMDDLSVSPSDKPDLEITDIWHEGSKIYYKIKNIGEAKAGSSKTELWVDGVSKKTDSVKSLGAGVERTESFKYKWTCSDTSDKIEVCADYKNAVVESNDANNCKTETWVPSYPDLVITDIWYTKSKIYYKIKNIGEAKAGSSKTELWVDGISKKTDSVRSLGAGAEKTESFKYKWSCSGTSDEIEVCADYKNAVAESNEGNNCKTEMWGVEYWAVIAGSPQCWLADNDAYDMYDGLLSYPNWRAENIRLLVDDCTRANVQAGIAWMASQADADDVCLFFYAGHGTHDTDIAPIDEADGWDEYICPEGNVPGTFIRDDELDAWMTTPIKGKKVVIIDSCHSGGFIRGEGVRALLGVPYAELTDGFVRDLNKPGYVTLTAADDDESAYGSGEPYGTLENGVFTYYVVEGLGGPANTDGDNDISAEETYDYAEPRAIDYTAAHPEWYPAPQHPQLYDGVTGEQPVVKWS